MLFYSGLRNLSGNNRLRNRFSCSKSRQVIEQDFYKTEFQTGKQNRAYRLKTGPVTVFKTGHLA